MPKVLIVDDSALIRKGIRETIERATDWTVSEAENGKVAVAMVDDCHPDLIILDLAMPLMNGIEAAREISKIVPGLPMIMFTLHAGWVFDEAQRAGIKHVFSKTEGFGQNVIDAMRVLLPA